MKEINIKKILTQKQALLKGHFLLSSGLHSSQYVQCAKVLQYPDIADAIGCSLAKLIKKNKPQTVVSPALGGVIIGQSVAKALSVRSIFTERQNNEMVLRRGFSVKQKEKVIIVEDVITTGKSTGEVIQVIKNMGAEVLSVCCIINRSNNDLNFSVPVYSLLKIPIEAVSAEECILCKKGLPLVKPGSRKIN